MNDIDKTLSYLSILTEGVEKSISKYEEIVGHYKSGNVDPELEILNGVKDASEISKEDTLKLHTVISSDPKLVRKIFTHHMKNPDKLNDYFSYMPEILNELLNDEKNADKYSKLIADISNSYTAEISKLGETKAHEDLIKKIRGTFVLSPPYLNFLNRKDKTPMISSEPDIPSDSLNEEIESFINELNEGVGIKDSAKAAAVVADKATSEKLHNIVNKIKTNYTEARKEESTEKVLAKTWPIKRQLRRIIKATAVSIFNPGLGLLTYIALSLIDRKLDKSQRAEYIGDLKLDIRLLDDKIAEAESKGDNKAKVQLIREKDKLERALEKLQRNR